MANWWCHRDSEVKETTGLKESLIHVAMLGEAGLCVLAGLLVEVNAPVLATMIASFFLHEAAAMWDVSYAVIAREVTPSSSTFTAFWRWCR